MKGRYDGRGSECSKMGKWSKGRQEMGVNVARNGRALLLKGEGVQIRKGRRFAERQERLVWQQDAGE